MVTVTWSISSGNLTISCMWFGGATAIRQRAPSMLSFNKNFTETECAYCTSTGLKSTILSFLAYSQLYSRRHNFGTFSSLHSETLYPLAVNLHFFQTLFPEIPQQPLSFFLTLWIFLLWTVHINGIKQYKVLLQLACFTQHNVFRVHPCHSMTSFSVPSYILSM